MKSITKKFERTFIRSRNAIERKGIRMIQAAIVEQYKEFIEKAMRSFPSSWSDIQISEKPVQQFFERFYPMSAPLGQMTRKHLIAQAGQKKSVEDDLYLSVFEREMQRLVGTSDYAARIKSITDTTKDRINTVLQQVLTEAELNGYGIETIRGVLSHELRNSFTGNVRARAKAIAQTEMISASNQASTFAADSTGLEYRKFWSTSHLQGIRLSHIQAEQDSIARGGLRKDQPFINGLMYPGDPSGPAEEVINCRCTVLHEIV